MVFRSFTEKKQGFDIQAKAVCADLRDNLGIAGLEDVRIFNRYDIEGISPELYDKAAVLVFSEPPVDNYYTEEMPEVSGCILAVEAIPGQFDQRADSCAQCLQIISGDTRPLVVYAKIYVFSGEISPADFEKVKDYLINPVESRKASLSKPDTLIRRYPHPDPVGTVDLLASDSEAALEQILTDYGLAMDMQDLKFLRRYFVNDEKRDPTVTELKVIDTYWSDHCRHTTFSTHIQSVSIDDPAVKTAYDAYLDLRSETGRQEKPMTLMDLATIGTSALKKRGLLPELDESEEVNACSIKITADIDGKDEDWLLMFKNETHNHPTEIEPFGGAATCIGGAIRDPLSGRSYVYQAMRVTGAADPTAPIEDTLPSKLPQRKLTTTAAEGYSSYGNQIGLATGQVTELYHPGYAAKRMEVGAVVAAAPAENVVRTQPLTGDQIILVGGRTGRDGCGGATGSSKTHDLDSLSDCAAEVQKGNAPEERKIQRLFRNPGVAKIIKRCNDFGAGGVSVAIGELADSLDIDLGAVRKKYEGLDGTEIAISESQERMAVVVSPENAELFISEAERENLEAYIVAEVTDTGRMVMKLDGRTIVDLSRDFLASNGAVKTVDVAVGSLSKVSGSCYNGSARECMASMLSDLRFCSQRGLYERFDSTVGASSILSPGGGYTQLTPAQSMAALLPVMSGHTTTASVMAYGFDPYVSEQNPYDGSKAAVVTSVAKLVASGCDPDKAYLSLQEYFERLRQEPKRWGKPFAALLGALDAQIGLQTAAIGGKDSMSGSFMDIDVPPTLISFAIAPAEAEMVISPEFKKSGSPVYLFKAADSYSDIRAMWQKIRALTENGKVLSAWSVTQGGAAEGIFKMSLGNKIGFISESNTEIELLFDSTPGSIVVEASCEIDGAILLGHTTDGYILDICSETIDISELQAIWEAPLETVFPTRTDASGTVETISYNSRSIPNVSLSMSKPKAVIPAFPGTNCEEDTRRAVERAGGAGEIVVIRNLTPDSLSRSIDELERAIRDSQMIIIPGGFSSGDEPGGSAKFIASFFRSPSITEATHSLLKNRDGLMLGICNGFQALIKLGLVPYGEIRPMTDTCPTLTYNAIGRHQSKFVTTRVASVRSPWMGKMNVGDLHTIPVSHGEGRFAANVDTLSRLIEGGQIATQYTDANGNPSMDIDINPNGSVMAIEAITSPDGRVLGKMGHTEREGRFIGKNIPGNLYQPLFEGGVSYFK